MPGGKQKAVTLSFSKKNEDIHNLLEDKKKNTAFVQNDYICDAIRFYEKNKNKINNDFDKDKIIELIDKRIKELIDNDLIVDKDKVEKNFNNKKLEENLDFDDFLLADD